MASRPEPLPGKDRERPAWVRLSGAGFELAAAVVGFTLLGYWLDRHFGIRPWGVLAGAALGMVGGLYNLIRESLWSARVAREEDAERRRERR